MFNSLLKTIWNFVVGNKILVFVTSILIAICLYAWNWYNDIQTDLAFWKNESAKYRGIYEVTKNNYEVQALELEKIKLLNNNLSSRISDTDREVFAYQKLILFYERELGRITTTPYPPDTGTAAGHNGLDTPSTKRYFERWFDTEVYIAGNYDIVSPFELYIKVLALKLQPEIVLSQSPDDTWFANIDTKSNYLRPEMFHVEIQPKKTPFEYFISSNIIFNKFTSFDGFGIVAGIKKAQYGIGAGFNVSNTNSYQFTVNCIYFNSF